MVYIKKEILASITYSFFTGKSVSKDIENIKERKVNSTVFKEEFGENEIICNKIQTSISLWKEHLEKFIENNKKTCYGKKYYYWLGYDGLKTIISMNPCDRLGFFKNNREKETFSYW